MFCRYPLASLVSGRNAVSNRGLKACDCNRIGSTGYLNAEQRLAVLEWLEQKNYWDLQELQAHLEESLGVVFQSNQSYYELFHEAGVSWKKTQKRNPKKDPELVEKKNRRLRLGWRRIEPRLNQAL